MAASTYPPPPPFYRLYKDYLDNPDSAPAPPPPIEGPYMLYGASYTTDDMLPSLEEQGVRQLYPKGSNVDYKKELKSLNRELLFQMLELADVLVERPSQYARRVEDLSLIFKNMYHLLNSLRPYQEKGGGSSIAQGIAFRSRWHLIQDNFGCWNTLERFVMYN